MTAKVTFRVARSGDAVYVRVTGMGTMNNSVTFKDFVDRMQRDGYRMFVVDLADCRGIDSTFMGILLGLKDGLVVVNTSAHCKRQMESVGLHRIVRVQEGPVALPGKLELKDLPDAEADPTTRLKLILKAHKDLCAIDKKNEERFGAFLKDIQKNLEKPPGSADAQDG